MSETTASEETLIQKILVVDDEPEVLGMVVLCLKKNNYEVSTAENAAEAYSMMETELFDAVISDVVMPGEDGISFLGRVHESWPDIPVILMTGHAELQMAVDAIKSGAFDFIYKPFDFEYLSKITDRAVNFSKLQRKEKMFRAELEETVARRTAELRTSMLELDFARKAFQQVAADKSAFMSTVSHEMRTPMNGVIGSLDLLAESGLSGADAEYLAMARQSAASMMALIDQLLSFNVTIKGGCARFKDLLNLESMLRSKVEENRSAFKRKKLELLLQTAPDLPEQIWTDREKLERLIEILLSNALKFTESGTVSLAASRFNSEAEGEMLLFAVTDSGTGIPDGMLERIFEPFVLGDASLTRRHDGLGLGLAIARQNAILLNGRLWAENVPGGGSCFKFAMKVITP